MAAYTTIDDPEAYFQTVLYTGNATDDRNITLPGTTDMQPDLVWIKERSSTSNHQLTDAVRGVGKHLNSDDAAAEGTNADRVQAFNSDGFQIGTDSSVNQNTITHVAWCWKAGTTSGITTDGNTTITPSGYSFNQTAGFSILKYTGNATSGAKLAHGLGATPEMVICKNLDSGNSWVVGHQGADTTAPWDYGMNLDSAAARSNTALFWNDTAPDNVNITLGSSDDNNEAAAHIAYCFAGKQGYSKFGGYGPGNANADGPFIYTGFKPAYLLIKITDAASIWVIQDNKRPGYNLTNIYSAANTTTAEPTNLGVDMLANGFKIRDADTEVNGSGKNYIYAAFAEAPFVNSNGVPCTAK